MEKRLRVGIFLIVFINLISFVSAVHTVSTSEISGGYKVSVSSASGMYAYEVNFSLPSGTTASDAVTNRFLGSSTSFGSSLRDDYFTVYESRLDSGQTGVTGDGDLFNFSYTGTAPTLKGSVQVSTDGTTEIVTYNPDGSVASVTVVSTGKGGGVTSAATPEVARASISAIPEELIVFVTKGIDKEEEIVLINEGDTRVTVQVEVKGISEFVELPSLIDIEPGKSKTLKIN